MFYGETPREELILAIIERDGDICYLCNVQGFSAGGKRSRTVDHYHSQDYCRKNGISAEVYNYIDNLKLAHQDCNHKKSNRIWVDGALQKVEKVSRKVMQKSHVCEFCYAGRLVDIGDVCLVCGSGPQPVSAPRVLMMKPSECSHTRPWHCKICWIR